MKEQRIDNPVGQRAMKRLYSIKEAAVYLGRGVWSVREMLYAGKLPCIKDGRRVLLDIKDLDNWIDRNKTEYGF